MSSLLASLSWNFAPSILIGLISIGAGYFLAIGPLRSRYHLGAPVPVIRQIAFAMGLFFVFLALCSPLDDLGDEYLFSAHMVQHMLLTFVAPPLWLVGMPAWLLERIFPVGRLRKWMQMLIAPLPAFLIFTAVVWVWHIPTFYNATLENEGLHIFEHLTFMASAVIGWAPALVPAPLNPQPPAVRVLYLFLSTFPCTALAAVMTFSGRVLYQFYLDVPRIAGISPLTDQWVGGLVMWLVGDMIFVITALVILGRSLDASEEKPVDYSPAVLEELNAKHIS